MGYYEDHLKAVAKHQAERMKKGESEKLIRAYLEKIGWQPSEVDAIIKLAKGVLL